MTEAWISLAEDCQVLLAEGHAGEPLACAGVSAILYALACFLQNMPRQSGSVERFALESGKACFSCRGDKTTAAAFRMAALGLMQLAVSFPGHLQVHYWQDEDYFESHGPKTAEKETV